MIYGNTEGRFIMQFNNNILTLKGPCQGHPLKNEYKKSLKLSDIQRNILVGTLLGDAHLESHGKINPMYRYCFSQKKESQVYVEHIYSFFEDWCSKPPSFSKTGINKNGDITESCYFRTCTHPSFQFYATQFYQNNIDNNIVDIKSHSKIKRIKIVPNLLHKWLNPMALAYWYMDDGSYDPSGYILNTQNFSFKEQEQLAHILGRIFKFEVNIRKDRNNFRLYITYKSKNSFTKIIKPFILPYFEYKLHNISP